MNEPSPERVRITGLAYLQEAFQTVISAINADPEAVKGLTDAEVLAANAWTGGEQPFHGECYRRQSEYQRKLDRFAAFGRTELVPILAERPKS